MVRRFQYAAIDDATRIRALRIYERHMHANAIKLVDHVIAPFPFRVREIRTDTGHEFQAKSHWHIEDQEIRHAYIKPSAPQFSGKVERSYRSDKQEITRLLSYKSDTDLEAKFKELGRFTNLARPHGVYNGDALGPQSQAITVNILSHRIVQVTSPVDPRPWRTALLELTICASGTARRDSLR